MEGLAGTSALLDYFVRGGSWMWALLACSVMALAVIIYKSVTLWQAGRGARALVDQVAGLMRSGQHEEAARRLAGSSAAVASVLREVLAAARTNHGTPLQAAEVAGTEEMAVLESGLPVLATIANIAPLIGFLGTVSGMIRAFTAISVHGLGEPGVVAAGIGEALITTAGGLIVAIPCWIAYGALAARVGRLALGIETAATRMASLLMGEGGGDEA